MNDHEKKLDNNSLSEIVNPSIPSNSLPNAPTNLLGNKREAAVMAEKILCESKNDSFNSDMEEKAGENLRKSERTKKEKTNTMDYILCHLCNKTDHSSTMVTCSNSVCGVSFCFTCIKKNAPNEEYYSSLKASAEKKLSWVCYVCNKSCACKFCKISKSESKNNNNNIITIPNSRFLEEKNEVKIDDYVIYEGEGPENESEFDEEDKENKEKIINNDLLNLSNCNDSSFQAKKNEIHKINSVVQNVESLGFKSNVNKNITRKCVCCERTDIVLNELLKFKTVEEFSIYFKNEFERKGANLTTDPIAFEENRNIMNVMSPSLNNILKLNLKSVKYLCKNCLVSKLNTKNGFDDIYKALEVNIILETSKYSNLERKIEEIIPSNINNNSQNSFNDAIKIKSDISEFDASGGNNSRYNSNNIVSNTPINMNENNALLKQLIEMQNSLNSRTQTINTLNMNNQLHNINQGINTKDSPDSFNPLYRNFNKLVEGINSFNSKNLDHNQNVVNNVSNLTGMLTNFYDSANKDVKDNLAHPKENESILGENTMEAKNDEEKKDDGLNVTNIIMNFDNQAQKNPVLSYMMNVLDDLKKQIVNIQYYSMLQRMFISYIFKNLEVFMEQIVNNQGFNEIAKNNPGLISNFGNLTEIQNTPIYQKMMSANMGNPSTSCSAANNLNEMLKKVNPEECGGRNPMDLLKNLTGGLPNNSGLNNNSNSNSNSNNITNTNSASNMMSTNNNNMNNNVNNVNNNTGSSNINQMNQNSSQQNKNISPAYALNPVQMNSNQTNQNALLDQLLKRSQGGNNIMNPNLVSMMGSLNGNMGMSMGLGNIPNLSNMSSLNNLPNMSSVSNLNSLNGIPNLSGMGSSLQGMPMMPGLGSMNNLNHNINNINNMSNMGNLNHNLNNNMNLNSMGNFNSLSNMNLPNPGLFNLNMPGVNALLNKHTMNNISGQFPNQNMPYNLLNMVNHQGQNISESLPGFNLDMQAMQGCNTGMNFGPETDNNDAREKLMKMFSMNQIGANMSNNTSSLNSMSNMNNMHNMSNNMNYMNTHGIMGQYNMNQGNPIFNNMSQQDLSQLIKINRTGKSLV
jgi:hypothetical protein